MYHAVPVFRSPIGNLDALSFLNGATVGYDESRVPAGTSGGRESAGRCTVGKTHVKGPEGISPGLLHAPGCGGGWMLSCALWLFLKQPTIAHIRANAARPFASCLLSTPAGFPRHRHSPWRPHPEKGVGLYLPSQRIAPGRRKPFFTAIRCRLFCPRWLPVVFCRTCRGAGGADRAQRVCVDAGCPSHRRPSPTP